MTRDHAYTGAVFARAARGYVGYCKCGHATAGAPTKRDAQILLLAHLHAELPVETDGPSKSAPAGESAPSSPPATKATNVLTV